MKYTDEQLAVAHDRSNRLLVKALAGTGKTETVALRIETLVNEGMDASEIQTLCFTKSARQQLRKRLDSKGLHAVDVRTVHSLAFRTVKEYFQARSREMPKIITGEFIAAKALTGLGISPTDENINVVLRVSAARWNGYFDSVAMGGLTVEEMLAGVELYMKLKREFGVFDHDDLIAAAGQIVESKYSEVIVDEAQDVSALQNRFISKMTQDRMVWVGDSNQSIFSFAGVDASLITRLDDWKMCTLSESFRSGQPILDVANQLIDEDLQSNISEGLVEVSEVGFNETASFIAMNIKKNHSVGVVGRTRFGLERIAVELEAQKKIVARSWDDVERSDADVTVSTVHKAKGGEWDQVFVADLTGRGFIGSDETEEEKRLFYVAVTRAKKDLQLITIDGELPWKIKI